MAGFLLFPDVISEKTDDLVDELGNVGYEVGDEAEVKPELTEKIRN